MAKCKKCKQTGELKTGEYPCEECERPTVWDDSALPAPPNNSSNDSNAVDKKERGE